VRAVDASRKVIFAFKQQSFRVMMLSPGCDVAWDQCLACSAAVAVPAVTPAGASCCCCLTKESSACDGVGP
jgi:hypothetical protein